MNKSNNSNPLVYLYVVVAIAIIGLVILGVAALNTSRPESSGAFEMSGEFARSYYSGSLKMGGSEDHNTWVYTLILTQDEFDRVENTYTDWQRLSYYVEENRPGYIKLGRESTGNWCGPLPPEGVMVYVDSPTGYTKDVTITNLETGWQYKSKGKCQLPTFVYHYRVTVQATGEIIEKGIVEGRDSSDARRNITSISSGDMDDYLSLNAYVFQIWEESQDPPPPIEPQP